MPPQRDPYIDFLKAVGLLMIMLAHVRPPMWLYELRSFDVPLMLFASGLVFSGRQTGSYLHFVRRRTLRLILPVYIFLTGYFIGSWLCGNASFTPECILSSFLLLGIPGRSIGYVWVIKVFLLVMLVTPLLQRIDARMKQWQWPLFVGFLFLCLEAGGVLMGSLRTTNLPLYYTLYETLQPALAYSIPFVVGLRVRRLAPTAEHRLLVAAMLLMALVLLALDRQTGSWQLISTRFKYPPRAAFVAYGTLVSLILWAMRKPLAWLADTRLVGFVGRHSIWIYLWHIPLVALTRPMAEAWLLRLIIVAGAATAVFFIQYCLAEQVRQRRPMNVLSYLTD